LVKKAHGKKRRRFTGTLALGTRACVEGKGRKVIRGAGSSEINYDSHTGGRAYASPFMFYRWKERK